MRTIHATGDSTEKPRLTISGGRGNTGRGEIHVQARAEDENGQTRTIAGWFSRDALLDAIHDADAVTRVSEPAVSE